MSETHPSDLLFTFDVPISDDGDEFNGCDRSFWSLVLVARFGGWSYPSFSVRCARWFRSLVSFVRLALWLLFARFSRSFFPFVFPLAMLVRSSSWFCSFVYFVHSLIKPSEETKSTYHTRQDNIR